MARNKTWMAFKVELSVDTKANEFPGRKCGVKQPKSSL